MMWSFIGPIFSCVRTISRQSLPILSLHGRHCTVSYHHVKNLSLRYITTISSDPDLRKQNLPPSIREVLDVIKERYKDLEKGVSDVDQLLEALNQLINSCYSVPNATPDLAQYVFCNPCLTAFLNNSIIKSVRRFTPSDVLRVCFIVWRAECLGIRTLQNLLHLSIKRLISLKTSSSPFGGLSISLYCQLPLMLTAFRHLDSSLKSDVIQWMNNTILETPSSWNDASLVDLECLFMGLSQFPDESVQILQPALTQLETLLEDNGIENKEPPISNEMSVSCTPNITMLEIGQQQLACQLPRFLLYLSRLSIPTQEQIVRLLFSRATGVSTYFTPESICDILLSLVNFTAKEKTTGSLNLLLCLSRSIDLLSSSCGSSESQIILHCVFKLEFEDSLTANTLTRLFYQAFQNVKRIQKNTNSDVNDNCNDMNDRERYQELLRYLFLKSDSLLAYDISSLLLKESTRNLSQEFRILVDTLFLVLKQKNTERSKSTSCSSCLQVRLK